MCLSPWHRRLILNHTVNGYASLRLLLVFVALAVVGVRPVHAQGIGPHFGGSQLVGDAAGLSNGYTNFDAFLPLRQRNGQSLTFFDGGVLLYNHGANFLGSNVGLGNRFFSPSTGTILGGYAYYDRRATSSYDFDQVGCGIESLGSMFDARVNVNVPVGKTLYSAGGSGAGFVGNQILIFGSGFSALTVLDGEVGALLMARPNFQLRSFLGSYGLFNTSEGDLAGFRGRMEARIHDQFWLGGYIENDDLFNTTGGFTFEWRFGRGRRPQNSSYNTLLARLGDPVRRRKYVAIDQNGESTTVATIDGDPVTVTHVDGGSSAAVAAAAKTASDPHGGKATSSSVGIAASGDGTFENPFNSLSSIAGATTKYVVVHSGVYDGESIVVNHPGQYVLSESLASILQLDQGQFPLGLTTDATVIANAPGDAITLAADGAAVAGFNILSPGQHGIAAYGVNEVLVGFNYIELAGASGIYFGDVAQGNVFLNFVTQSADSGIRINSTLFSGDIVANTSNANGAAGFRLETDLVGDFASNTANGNVNDGLHALGSIQGEVESNTANENGDNGLWIVGSVTGYVASNAANDNQGTGIVFSANVSGNVYLNVTNGNGQDGIYVSGDVGDMTAASNIHDNTANENGLSGIYLGSDVYGDVLSNTTSENVADGIHHVGVLNGDMSGNTANGNGLSGHFLGGHFLGTVVLGEYSNNTTNDNLGDGLHVAGSGGSLIGNTANGNGLSGLYVLKDIFGNVSNNTTSDNLGFGVLIEGAATGVGGNLDGNSAERNAVDGLFVRGSVFGDVNDNLTNDNGRQGIFIHATVQGSVHDNNAHRNVESGIHVLSAVFGSVFTNAASNNGVDGLFINSTVSGNLTDNTTLANGDDGIDVNGTISGTISGNVAAGNGDQALEN